MLISGLKAHFSSSIARWICIYPAYLNSNKTKAEGRLVPKAKGVPNPSFMEIRDVLIR